MSYADDFDAMIQEKFYGRGAYYCNFVSEDGRPCRFPADYMTGGKYTTPAEPYHCGRHLPENHEVEMQEEREHAARVAAAPPPVPHKPIGESPACWDWVVTDEIRADLAASEAATDRMERVNLFMRALSAFDNGLCAICGNPGNDVEDHCHETGFVRGWLCRSCNVREGMNRGIDNVWGRYRRRNPYSMLGLKEPYDGFGWENGKPIGAGDEWPPPPPTDEERWANNPMRGAL